MHGIAYGKTYTFFIWSNSPLADVVVGYDVLLVNKIRRVFVGAIIRILGVHVFVFYSFGL